LLVVNFTTLLAPVYKAPNDRMNDAIDPI
jgi:hypothetical protein